MQKIRDFLIIGKNYKIQFEKFDRIVTGTCILLSEEAMLLHDEHTKTLKWYFFHAMLSIETVKKENGDKFK